LLRPLDPILLAIGGFSGTGKSTVASQVAAFVGRPPGARILNTDRIRKAEFGVSAEQPLPVLAYATVVSKQVYEKLRRTSGEVLATGTAVIADAVFDRPDERSAIQRLAEDIGIPFYGIWLDAPEGTAISRIAGRQGGPSDADAAVLAAQIERGCGTVTWRRVDALSSPADVRNAVLVALNPIRREPS
jgi:predicted kinase